MIYRKPSKQFGSKFLKLVKDAGSVLIVPHLSPDDDAAGSALAIFHIAVSAFPDKKIRMVFPGAPITRYGQIRNADKIQYVKELTDHLENVDLIVFVDGGQYHRFSRKPAELHDFPGKTICVDHHQAPGETGFDEALIVPGASSSAELIYHSFRQLVKMDKVLAEGLLMGILGDTGNFTYLGFSQLDTLHIAHDLCSILKTGIQEFKARYQYISKGVFALTTLFMQNTRFRRVKGWPPFQYSLADRASVEKEEYGDDELSAASHFYIDFFVRLVEDYRWGFVIYPRADGSCRISLRALPGSVDVNQLAHGLDERGGGHTCAAGANFKPTDNQPLEPAACAERIIDWLKRHKTP